MGLIRLLLTSRRTLSRAWRLARDERVPMRLKVMAAIGVLLILSPLNLLGDIPLLGFFDDAVLRTGSTTSFKRPDRLVPAGRAKQARRAITFSPRVP
jgi:uncharacterized membrane protein YkvA (DUF1232 family)